MTIALPDRKLADFSETLGVLQGRQKCTQRELLALVGRLVHASECVPPGRAFTRRLLDAAHSVSGLNHRVRITAAVRAAGHDGGRRRFCRCGMGRFPLCRLRRRAGSGKWPIATLFLSWKFCTVKFVTINNEFF